MPRLSSAGPRTAAGASCPPGAPGPAGSCSGTRRASLPEPGSPAVPGEGAQEPDTRSQGRPHRAGPGSEAENVAEGGRGAGRVALAGSRPGLNAPRPGPPRLGGQTPGAPAPLHLKALGVRPARADRQPPAPAFSRARPPSWRPSELLGAPPALHFLLTSRLGTESREPRLVRSPRPYVCAPLSLQPLS